MLNVLQIVIVCTMCIAVYLCVLTLEEEEVAGSKHTRAHIGLVPPKQTNEIKKVKEMDGCTSHFSPYQLLSRSAAHDTAKLVI